MPPKIHKPHRIEEPRVLFVHRTVVPLDETKKPVLAPDSVQSVAKDLPDIRILREETQSSVLVLPAQAWVCHEMCIQAASKRNRSKALFYLQLIPLTMVTICASVLYGHMYTDGWYPSLDDPTQIALFASTIIVPLYITWLMSKEKELRAPKPYHEAAARIESETFKFRSGVSPYQLPEHASLHFKTKMQTLLDSLLCEFEADGKSLPEKEFWNETPSPPTTSTSVLTASRALPPRQSPLSVDLCVLEQQNKSLLIEELPSRSSPRRNWPGRSHRHVKRRNYIDLEKGPPTENTELLSGTESTNTNEKDGELETATNKTTIIDDCVSPLTSEEYLQIRNQKWLSQKTLEVHTAKRQKEALSKVIQGITVSCSAVALISMQWFVPIMLAMAAALGSTVEVAKLGNRIELGEKTLGKLEDLNSWWTSELTNDQRDELSQKERLITETEQIILHGKLA